MLVQMGAEPSHSHRPECGGKPFVLGSGIAPYVGVMVAYRTLAAVHFTRCNASVFTHTFDVVEQRRMALGQILYLRAPVIHFRVDVHGVLAAPCGPHILVPYALQVQGKRVLAASRYHQVTGEVEVQLNELVVLFALLYLLKPFVRGKLRIAAAVVAKLKLAAFVKCAVVGDMPCREIEKALAYRRFCLTYCKLFVIGCAESSLTGNCDQSLVGVFHMDTVSVNAAADIFTFGRTGYSRRIRYSVGHGEKQGVFVVSFVFVVVVVLAVDKGGKVYFSLLAGGKMYRDNIIGAGGENCSRIGNAAAFPAGRADGIYKVETSFVVGIVLCSALPYVEIA